ncbi:MULTISPECIES: HEPN domain-containing protein [unclassified Vibrio]|uniref:HEPN domain-containing protein n=2 Tax=Vibrionaceae TaxID=641 RepID=UPI003553FED9
MKSIARQEFQVTISALKKQVSYSALKKSNIPHDIQQCVYRNAIFQTSAALEEYVKALLEDWIHKLHANYKTIRYAPEPLILWAAGKKQKNSFQHFIAFGDESKLISSLASTHGLHDVFNKDSLAKDVICQSGMVRDRKYPSKKNLVALFKRFGINDIFKSMQIKGKKDYKKNLESFSDIRTMIAHEHPTPDITAEDTRKQLLIIDDFIAKLDAIMYSHVVSISGSDCWKTSRLF